MASSSDSSTAGSRHHVRSRSTTASPRPPRGGRRRPHDHSRQDIGPLDAASGPPRVMVLDPRTARPVGTFVGRSPGRRHGLIAGARLEACRSWLGRVGG